VQATVKTVELARGMQHMRGFVHVSTAYVDSNLPRGSHIEERIYPLHDAAGARIEHAALAERLGALPAAKAEQTVTPPV
jgi:fatty acyl-CoA reductase